MPLQNLPEDIAATDNAGLSAEDHRVFHDTIHGRLNAPLPQGQTERVADYTLAAVDANDMLVTGTTGDPIVITIPPESSVNFRVGTIIGIYRKGSGTVTVTPGVGVDLESPPNTTGSRGIADQFGTVVLWKRFSDKWAIFGNLLES